MTRHFWRDKPLDRFRGTGKSTWIEQTFPEALVVDLLRPAVFRQLRARPEKLVERVQGSPERIVVLDEVSASRSF